MTLYDALNLPPAFLVMLGLIALAIACISVGVYFFGEEGLVEWGLVAKTANFVAWSGFLMVLGFVICYSLTQARTRENASMATASSDSASHLFYSASHHC